MDGIGMICMDLDGTLLDPKGNISETDAEAVRRAQRAGIVCAIASGRAEGNVVLMMRDAGLRCPFCALNGGLVMDENAAAIASHPMDRDLALRLCDVLAEEKLHFVLLGEKAICTSSEDFPHHSEKKYGERMRRMGHRLIHGMAGLRAFAQSGTSYKYYLCDMADPEGVRERLEKIPGIGITRSGSANIEVMPLNVNKARGIDDLCAHYGVPPEKVMCIGDEMNDLEMIERFGCGVAMGNAPDEVKQRADLVTLDNASGGVAHAIGRLLGEGTAD